MKKRVILILCVLAVLLTAVICLPFARKIDTTVTATEYRFNDPAYAVEHTVVICGHDTRNLLGYGVFEAPLPSAALKAVRRGGRSVSPFPTRSPSAPHSAGAPAGKPAPGTSFTCGLTGTGQTLRG